MKRLNKLVGLGVAAGLALGGFLWIYSDRLESLDPRPHWSEPPSIVLVLVDTLRADHLGSYGFEGEISPNLDRLADESVLFEHCYSQAPWTKPAVATLFTSLHPQSHQVLTHRGAFVERAEFEGQHLLETDALPDEAVTLAELLRDRGYATAAFVANPWIRQSHGFAQGFDHFDDSHAGNSTSADRVLKAASAWLATRPLDRPFFLYLHLMDVHGPYDAPDHAYQEIRGSPSLDRTRELTAQELGRLPSYLKETSWFDHPKSGELGTWRGRYAAGVRAFDLHFAPFLEQLRSSGVLDSSLLVLTGDHGEQILEHGAWDHGHGLYEHDLRVPLLLRFPRAEAAGTRVTSLVGLIDIMPTLLATAGVEPPPGSPGRDLLDLSLGRQDDGYGSDAVFFSGVKWRPQLRGLRSGQYKLLADRGSGVVQLFDLDLDPRERRNIAPERPRLVRDLVNRLRAFEEQIAAVPGLRPASAQVSTELEERLKSLGYVE